MRSCLAFGGEVTFPGASPGRSYASGSIPVLDIKDGGDRERKSKYREPCGKLIPDLARLRFGKSAQEQQKYHDQRTRSDRRLFIRQRAPFRSPAMSFGHENAAFHTPDSSLG